MTQPPELEALFRAERAAAPAASAADRGWLKLAQDLAAQVPPLAIGSGPLKPVSWLIAKWILSGLTIGFVASAVIAVSSSRVATEWPTLEASPRVATVTASRASVPVLVSAQPASSTIPSSTSLAAPAQMASSAASVNADSEPQITTFDAELALISRAKSELDAHRFAATEITLREHATRFPHGVFATERDGLLVLVSCERGPKNAKLAEKFANLHPGAAISARLSRACGAAANEAPSSVVDFSKSSNETSAGGAPTAEPRTGNQP